MMKIPLGPSTMSPWRQGLDDIDQSVEAFREACLVDDDLYKLRLEELLEQGLVKEANNEDKKDYINGAYQGTND